MNLIIRITETKANKTTQKEKYIDLPIIKSF